MPRTIAERKAFDRIANPLWKALAMGHKQEVARLQEELRQLIAKHGQQSFVRYQDGSIDC